MPDSRHSRLSALRSAVSRSRVRVVTVSSFWPAVDPVAVLDVPLDLELVRADHRQHRLGDPQARDDAGLAGGEVAGGDGVLGDGRDGRDVHAVVEVLLRWPRARCPRPPRGRGRRRRGAGRGRGRGRTPGHSSAVVRAAAAAVAAAAALGRGGGRGCSRLGHCSCGCWYGTRGCGSGGSLRCRVVCTASVRSGFSRTTMWRRQCRVVAVGVVLAPVAAAGLLAAAGGGDQDAGDAQEVGGLPGVDAGLRGLAVLRRGRPGASVCRRSSAPAAASARDSAERSTPAPARHDPLDREPGLGRRAAGGRASRGCGTGAGTRAWRPFAAAARGDVGGDALGEDQALQQGVGGEPVRAVHAGAGDLAARVQAGDGGAARAGRCGRRRRRSGRPGRPGWAR